MGPLTRLCHCDTEAGSTAIIAQHHDKVRPVIRRFGPASAAGGCQLSVDRMSCGQSPVQVKSRKLPRPDSSVPAVTNRETLSSSAR
jgi:hypothetical protein